jgi:phosphatidylserine decarboxylase
MIHKEGHKIVSYLIGFCIVAGGFPFRYFDNARIYIWVFLLLLLGFAMYFFRVPRRSQPENNNSEVIAPADGKVVAIETVKEDEYLKRDCKLISIFMSPLNVHINWNPVSGIVRHAQYHPGKYLVAWHPKSSTENERMSVVIETQRDEILVRQIAGAMARRIINYNKKGMEVQKGEELGFIRFGSRVDIYLPLNYEVQVSMGDKVKGKESVIALTP